VSGRFDGNQVEHRLPHVWCFATLNRVRVPKAFYDQVRPLVRPGATILVTQSKVGEDGEGRKLTVVDAVTPTL